MIAHSSASPTSSGSLSYQDEGGFAILVAHHRRAMASVGAVIRLARNGDARRRLSPCTASPFMLLTIALSWAFIHTMFALHYAHEFYALHGKPGKGRARSFRTIRSPTYWDFVYLAFASARQRRCPTCRSARSEFAGQCWRHGIVSFCFNVTLIALTVGLVGDAVQR